jgi:hypothetical protein
MTIVQSRKLFVAEYALSGYLNGLVLDLDPVVEDDTVFGDDTRSRYVGMDAFSVEEEGLWSAGTALPDTIFAAHAGLEDVLATVAPLTGAAGEIAFFGLTSQGAYKLGGAVGPMHRFSLHLSGSGGAGMVHGTILVNANLTATGDGTAYELGAVAATEKLYAGLHVTAVGGTNPTLDLILESDAADDFSGAETTRITFAQVTAAGSEWATPVAGAITDTWYRISYTIGGTASPNFDVVITVGVK